MKQNSRKDIVFLAVISLVHITFFLLTLHYKNIFNGDSFGYILEAINIKDHFLFYSGQTSLPIVEEYKTLRTPGYPLFLLLTYLFTINNWIVLLLQNIVSIFNIVYIRRAFISLGYNNRYDWLLLLFIIAFPSQFIFANIIAPDILLQTCVLFYFANAVKFLKEKKMRALGWMTIALVAGLFIKPVLYPYAFIHLIVFSAIIVHQRLKAIKGIAVALIPALCILVYSAWNYARTEKFHFTSIQSFNALYYYHHFLQDKSGVSAAEDFLQEERRHVATLTSFKHRYDYAHQRGTELLQQNFIPYITYHLKMSARFFLETGKGEIDMFTGELTLGKLYSGTTKGLREVLAEAGPKGLLSHLQMHPSGVFALVILLLNILRTCGFLLFLYLYQRQPLIRWFIAFFILYFALITGPISNAHYVLPVSLIMMAGACVGYARLLTARNNKAIIT